MKDGCGRCGERRGGKTRHLLRQHGGGGQLHHVGEGRGIRKQRTTISEMEEVSQGNGCSSEREGGDTVWECKNGGKVCACVRGGEDG